MSGRKSRHNKAGAGNGAGALSFQVGRLGRAVPDLIHLIRSADDKPVRLWYSRG
jgi:hypothetical protein